MPSATAPRTVVITGASAGLGRAIATAFAREGARIGIMARDQDRLAAVKKEVEQLGGQATVLVADVADPDAVEQAASVMEKTYGPIDIWVNNAMVSVFAPFHQTTAEEFRRVTEVTYLGTVYGTMAALRRMRPRNRGIIIQVGSALSDRSIPLQSAYCGAKHGIRGFTDSIRCELIHDNSSIQLTMVQLPAMNTPQFSWVKSRLPNKPQPVPPIFQPEVAADAVVWVSRHPRRELYVGMPTVQAMWGNKFFPGILDRYLGKTGYRKQQTAEPENPERPSNLWHPVPGDFGAHGTFDDRSQWHSVQVLLARKKWLLAGVATVAVAVAACATAAKSARPSRQFQLPAALR